MHPEELLQRGLDFLRNGDREQGTALIARAVKADPSLIQGWWALANLLGNPDQQVQCLKQVLKLQPDHPKARAKLVELETTQVPKTHSPDPSSSERISETGHIPPSRSSLSPMARPLKKHKSEVRPEDISTPQRWGRWFYVGATLMVIVIVGVLALLFARGVTPKAFSTLLGENDGGDIIVAAPSLPPEWTPSPALVILVPTGTARPPATETRLPSSPTTKSPATPSTTPTLRYTPTPTPTYNPRAYPKMTLAARAACPKLISQGSLELTEPDVDLYASADEILEYLNSGGSVVVVERALNALSFNAKLVQADLTHDGVPEIIVYSFAVYVFGCGDGAYTELLRVQPEIRDTRGWSMEIYTRDLTANGVQNLLITTDNEDGFNENYSLNVLVYGWDGTELVNLAPDEVHHPFTSLGSIQYIGGYAFSLFRGEMDLRDVDFNGTVEIILKNDLYLSLGAGRNLPYREETDTWMWNGETYNLVDVQLSPAVFNVHAVNDGDLAALETKYLQALQSYQRAINDPYLEVWNDARWEWRDYGFGPGEPRPTYPPPDPAEDVQVEAYAKYRIMLTYFLLNRTDQAVTQYQLLLSQHPLGDPGYAIAQMAESFYEAYDSTGTISAGCEAARAYAGRNENQVLAPINFGHSGWATISYEPIDICPF